MADIDFGTRADAVAATIPSTVTVIRLLGYAAPGQGAAQYVEVANSGPLLGWQFQSNSATRRWSLNETIVEPEMYGAVGDGVVNDDAAWVSMGAHGRARGFLNLVCRQGRTYTHTSPFALSCIRTLDIEGNGAKLKNIRGTLGLPASFNANFEALEFSSIFASNGQANYAGSSTPYNFGQLISSAGRGTVVVSIPIGTPVDSNLRAGTRALIYGFSRLSTNFPPAAFIFEYVEIKSVSGQDITLATPLTFNYDSRWPDYSVTGAPAGPPRILSADRPDFVETDVAIRNFETVPDPGWTGPSATPDRNGRATFSGYRNFILENFQSGGGMYISQGQNFSGRAIDTAAICELDQLLERCSLDKSRLRGLLDGGGVRSIHLTDTVIDALGSLNGMDVVTVDRCNILGQQTPAGALIGQTVGGRDMVIRDTSFVAANLATERLISAANRSFPATVDSAATLSLSHAEFTSASLHRSVFEDSVFYDDAGFAVFQCSALPYEVSGRVIFEGAYLGPVTTGDTLNVPVNRYVSIQRARYLGVNAARMTGCEPASLAPNMLTNVEDEKRGRFAATFDGERYPLSNAAHYFWLSGRYRPTRVVIVVERAYAGPTTSVVLNLRTKGSATVNLAAINLKIAGTRVLDLSGNFGAQTGDGLVGLVETLSAIDYRSAGVVDSSNPSLAASWSVKIEGIAVL